ncbi:MAG TPA: hypothetical protein VM240_13605 [Verrucomicrobiae bacterium]|nr:hypothetical protein [Verrucomicrobiae bacterium]
MLREYATSESFEIEEILKNGRIVKARVPKAPPTLARFAQQIGVCRDTIHKWSTEVQPTGHPQAGQLARPEFSEAVAYAKAAQEAILLEGAVLGLYNAPAAQFALKNYSGLQDKVENEQQTFPAPTAEELDAIYEANKRKMDAFNAGIRAQIRAGSGRDDLVPARSPGAGLTKACAEDED